MSRQTARKDAPARQGVREREREREKGKEREEKRQTDRQTDREPPVPSSAVLIEKREREKGKEREERERERERETDRQTDRQRTTRTLFGGLDRLSRRGLRPEVVPPHFELGSGLPVVECLALGLAAALVVDA